MEEKYNNELLGKRFKGNWKGSLTFIFGDLESSMARISWKEGKVEAHCYYPANHCLDYIKDGTWKLID